MTHGDAEREASSERVAGEVHGRFAHRRGKSIRFVVEGSNTRSSCSVS
jgi:hypothetical protein